MKKTIIVSAMLLSLGSTAVLAGDIAHKGTEAYVHGTDGNIVRDIYGSCVRTIHWSEAASIDSCEGRKAKPVVVAPKPVVVAPKPVVVAPKPVVVAPKPVVVAPVYKISAQEINTPLAFSGFFVTGSSTLNAEAKSKLNDYVDYLNQVPTANIKISGYTDSRGSASFNQKLSLKRANSVKSYLVSKGVAANRVDTVGLGESNPIASNNTRVGRAENRRVELEIIK